MNIIYERSSGAVRGSSGMFWSPLNISALLTVEEVRVDKLLLQRSSECALNTARSPGVPVTPCSNFVLEYIHTVRELSRRDAPATLLVAVRERCVRRHLMASGVHKSPPVGTVDV